jgi:ubiquinone/menaquinone biosynthesis C-methylase UbiE
MRVFGKRVPEGGAIVDESAMSAEEYGEIMKRNLGSEYRRFADRVLKEAPPPENATVLEIGPGPGWAGIELLKLRPDLTLHGMDASQDMVRAATANAAKEGVAARASYGVGTAEALMGAADGSIDLIISRDSLHHWEDPPNAFASILRVLKPTGRVFLCDERRDLSIPAWLLVRLIGPLMVGPMAKFWLSSIRAAYTPDELRALLPQVKGRAWDVEGGFLDLRLLLSAA